MKISDLLNDENGLPVKLRCDNYFDSNEYEKIKSVLIDNVKVWKKNGSVPNDDAVALMETIDLLAGGSRFWDKETAIKAQDAGLEIEDIIRDLIC